ncbi:MAG: HDOD domain-containing protein [Candidatus Riflemargulisbacteria bacterium]
MVDKDNLLYSRIVNKITELMPLPETIQKVVSLTRNPDTPLKKISDVLESDEAMASKVLKLANSSFYGFSKQVKTISHAVVCLGFNTIKQMSLTAHSFSVLDNTLDGYYLDKGAMFQHSFGTALASRLLATRMFYPNAEEVYLMGLLHDVGKVILNQYAEAEFKKVIELYNQGGRAFHEAEREILGFDHGEIGAAVCQKWNLSDDIVDTIRNHHSPEEALDTNLSVHMVHIANIIVTIMGIGIGAGGVDQKISEKSLTSLRLKEEDISMLMMSIMDELENDETLTSFRNK